MIDRNYGDLSRDGREHAITLQDTFTGAELSDVHAVDARADATAPACRPP
jgi:hypothetical protein